MINFIDSRIKKTIIKGKGNGFIATKDIPANSTILIETPSFINENYTQSAFDIFEILFVILNSNDNESKKLFFEFYPHVYDNQFDNLATKIKSQLKKLKKYNTNIYNYLTSHHDNNEIVLLSLKYICNAFNFFDMGPGILLAGSTFNHSCFPNIIFGKSIDGKMNFITIRDIKKDDELCINYIDISKSNKLRINHLLNQYGFTCNCERCSNQIKSSNLFEQIKIIKKKVNLKFNNV